MEIKGTFLGGGGDHHNYIGVDEATADMVYDVLKGFWTTRENQSEAEIKKIVENYRQSSFHDSMEPVRKKNSALYSARDPDRPFSMIDFGGANGSALYFMTSLFPEESLRYVLVEGFLPFVEDFRQHFPGHRAIHAGAEQFPDMPNTDFGETPLDVFFSSHVLYLIKPVIVRAILERASRLTDTILLADNLKNLHGEMDRENPVVFDYLPENAQVYFSHFFEGYFDDIDFEIVDEFPTQPRAAEMKLGFGVVHARRRG